MTMPLGDCRRDRHPGIFFIFYANLLHSNQIFLIFAASISLFQSIRLKEGENGSLSNVGGRMDFLHEVRFSAGIGPAHFPAETTRPLGRGCLPFSQK
jgi:hypothetical protein